MVTGNLKEKLVANMLVRDRHQITSDVSIKNGGQDEGPNPHELLEAALASCTIITVQMYANLKKWPLTSTEAKVAVDSETNEGAYISRELKFVGDLSDEQRQRLLEIANKCPIHKLLSGSIRIDTKML